jgi:hypothetical protein
LGHPSSDNDTLPRQGRPRRYFKAARSYGVSQATISRLLGELALERARGGWWCCRQRGGIEQNVPKRDNIEKVIPLSPIHIVC